MDKSTHQQSRNNNPSFSSSLLDAIYRSIDEPFSIERKRTPNPNPNPNLLDPRPRPVLPSDPPLERKITCSIPTRVRNLGNLRSPASPRTRIATFLNAIFAGSGKTKKPKFAGAQEEPARSCIKKMPEFSIGGKKRSVSFWPASSSGDVPMAMRDRRMLVEELLRGLEVEEEEESDCESVSSSDLFELESISAIGRFRDGLPLYETTTNLAANRPMDLWKKNCSKEK